MRRKRLFSFPFVMLEPSLQAPLVAAADLATAGRQPPFPFAVRLNEGSRLDLLRPLRVLPGKRIVGEGLWNGQRVLAKLFIASGSARHCRRECEGLGALAAAGIPTTPVLASGTLAGGACYLLTAFLPDAVSLADKLAEATADADAVDSLLKTVCAHIGRIHVHGLVHDDLHPGNILVCPDALRIIDGDAVRCRNPLPANEADDNLASFLAELLPDKEMPLDAAIASYRTANPGHAPTPVALVRLIEKHRQLLLEDYLRKTVRPCTLFDTQQTFRRFSVTARVDAAWLAPLLSDLDRAMLDGVSLKDSNTCTVSRVEFDGRVLVIKRYNIKSAGHALSRAWRPSRAWRSWREGHRLRFIGIDTPTPRALIEERLGPLRRRAWLIADYCAGSRLTEHLAQYVNAAAPPPAEGEALLKLFTTLHARRISHGDLKADNLLWDETRRDIAVIDLDAMTCHTDSASHARAWLRDRARLLANWPEDSGLYRWLDARLPKS